MIIVCPQCESRYELDDASLPQAGRTVRCVRCRAQWLAFPDGEDQASSEDRPDLPLEGVDAAYDEADHSDTLTRAIELADAVDLDIEHEPLHGSAHLQAHLEMDEEDFSAQDRSAQDRSAQDRSAQDRSVQDRLTGNRPARRGWFRRRPTLDPAARPARKRSRLGHALRRAGTLAILLAIAASLFVFREALARAYPGAASLYATIGLPVNLRGLAFEDVTTSHSTEGKALVLVIEGTIRNVTDKEAAVPRLRLAIRDDKGVELYSWSAATAHNVLSAGQILAFKSCLASPPVDGRSVAVRFLRPDDMLAPSK